MKTITYENNTDYLRTIDHAIYSTDEELLIIHDNYIIHRAEAGYMIIDIIKNKRYIAQESHYDAYYQIFTFVCDDFDIKIYPDGSLRVTATWFSANDLC